MEKAEFRLKDWIGTDGLVANVDGYYKALHSYLAEKYNVSDEFITVIRTMYGHSNRNAGRQRMVTTACRRAVLPVSRGSAGSSHSYRKYGIKTKEGWQNLALFLNGLDEKAFREIVTFGELPKPKTDDKAEEVESNLVSNKDGSR